ncbi:hypothetical protein HaLaN_01906 [Haematococcus lacustris]|uniref:Uncharacterized protein n=1 Tax=Haematococcus lacustris TaxID=44745 RepID=A0A699YCN8_HAELA|nr:hypothetical protein HaLaN_01906 [Haematococcus lacustris]
MCYHPGHLGRGVGGVPGPQVGRAAAEAVRRSGPDTGALEDDMAEVSMERHGRAKQLVVFFSPGAQTSGGVGWCLWMSTAPARSAQQ